MRECGVVMDGEQGFEEFDEFEKCEKSLCREFK